MVTIQTTMNWDEAALGKYNKMLNLIPVFHRRLAKEVVNKKAEGLAQARGAAQVQEEDIVRAFLSEVPKAFYSLMIRIMHEVGFDYKKYIRP
ncbi:MAG: PCP reductase family protein [Candidatus Omnitrophica bacterium]|nr:PCP reductase family protein [Candidatus Omnitrophota bacterium]